jgi:AraC-like DNA-binding protein
MLDLPNALANPALAGHAERLLGLVPMGRPEGSTTERTRHAIYLLIHSGSATIERVGEMLDLHPRSLQRQLVQEGRTFGQLLNETRRELAERYLAAAHHSLATISTLAGYSSQSAFTRWFAAEFGLSPAAWREQQHGRADAALAPHRRFPPRSNQPNVPRRTASASPSCSSRYCSTCSIAR